VNLAAFVESNRRRFLAELAEYCAIPSVAAEGRGLDEAAAWVRGRLEKLGATVEELPSPGAPVLYATLGPDVGRPLLIYNHYDVQPADPLAEWRSPPFEASIRHGCFFARGVADNKANFLSRVHAMEALVATDGHLPVAVRWLIEGEEEIGSPSLPEVCAAKGALWAGSAGCLWEAGHKDPTERLVMYAGCKGLAVFELRARGVAADMHSAYATLMPNAAWRLVWALATLKDARERICIDGFMDHVREPTADEVAYLEGLVWDASALREAHGVDTLLGGVEGAEALTRHLYSPTCTVQGLHSGYGGEGVKTVLPARAAAKVGFRLVPDLTPDLVEDLLRRHLHKGGFDDIEVVRLAGEEQVPGRVDTAVARSAAAAARQITGRPPVLWPLMAGTGPMYPVTARYGVPAVGFGTGYWASAAHAPNEHIRLADYFEGILVAAEFFRRFGAEPPGGGEGGGEG